MRLFSGALVAACVTATTFSPCFAMDPSNCPAQVRVVETKCKTLPAVKIQAGGEKREKVCEAIGPILVVCAQDYVQAAQISGIRFFFVSQTTGAGKKSEWWFAEYDVFNGSAGWANTHLEFTVDLKDSAGGTLAEKAAVVQIANGHCIYDRPERRRNESEFPAGDRTYYDLLDSVVFRTPTMPNNPNGSKC